MEIAIILACWLMVGLFELSEMSIVSSNRRRLARLAEQGSKGAAQALALLANPSKFLSTVQVGLTFGSIIAATYGGQPLAVRLSPLLAQVPVAWIAENAEGIARGGVSFLIGSLTIVCAEIVPKRLGLGNPEALAVAVSRPMSLMAALASPLVSALSFLADIILFAFGKKNADEDKMSEDELRMMVDQGMASGVLHAHEHRMVHGALSLDQVTAENLMTPSNRVVWLNVNDGDEVNWRKIVASGHTWFPVYQGTPDRPLGVVSVKRLWANLSLTGTVTIKDVLTDPPTVPPGLTGTELLERFRRDRIHLAVVTDEFGRVRGVVSLNDVLECVMGELPNEASAFRQNSRPVRRREDGSWLVDASVSLDDFREATGVIGRFPDEGLGRYTVIAGFLMRSLGRLPQEGDRVEALGHVFEVVDMDGHRVDKVLVMPKAAPAV
ncbi:MAG: hemolysin family protein [Opitutia bacterium]